MDNLKKYRISALIAVLAGICLLLSSCALFGDAEPGSRRGDVTGHTPGTVRPPDGEGGAFRWPADLLPEGFPALRGEVKTLEYTAEGKLCLGIPDLTWAEYRTFVSSLIADGWGSIQAGYARALAGEGGTTDSDALLGAVMAMAERFASDTADSDRPFLYLGERDGTEVICRFGTGAEDRFYLWLSETALPEPTAFPVLNGCRLAPEDGWTLTEDGEAALVSAQYLYDPSEVCAWTLSRTDADGRTPAAVGAEYMARIGEQEIGSDPAAEHFVPAGSTDAVSFSYRVAGVMNDVDVLYIAWQTADGAIWQFTFSFCDYDAPFARRTAEKLLSSLMYGDN